MAWQLEVEEHLSQGQTTQQRRVGMYTTLPLMEVFRRISARAAQVEGLTIRVLHWHEVSQEQLTAEQWEAVGVRVIDETYGEPEGSA